jgi:hypothetical protein
MRSSRDLLLFDIIERVSKLVGLTHRPEALAYDAQCQHANAARRKHGL